MHTTLTIKKKIMCRGRSWGGSLKPPFACYHFLVYAARMSCVFTKCWIIFRIPFLEAYIHRWVPLKKSPVHCCDACMVYWSNHKIYACLYVRGQVSRGCLHHCRGHQWPQGPHLAIPVIHHNQPLYLDLMPWGQSLLCHILRLIRKLCASMNYTKVAPSLQRVHKVCEYYNW